MLPPDAISAIAVAVATVIAVAIRRLRCTIRRHHDHWGGQFAFTERPPSTSSDDSPKPSTKKKEHASSSH
jgi:hypothetical protein